MQTTFQQRTLSHACGTGIFYYHLHHSDALSATSPWAVLNSREGAKARTAATRGAALLGHFPLLPLSILIHTGTSWLLSVWGDCSQFLWDIVRRAAGTLLTLPAARRAHNPPVLTIVSTPTCLKFLRDTDISQQGFNNSLIIAPDNNLHCIECSPVGGWVEGLPW